MAMNNWPFARADELIILAYLVFALWIALRYRKQASRSFSDFILGGRSLPWYLAGLSMVATTFAADTPLWVTEKVAQHGVSGNWLWWNMLIGGMLTTFFFARYWRRAGILTELELLEFRYSGKVASWLRSVRAVYLGGFLNLVILAWVNKAMLVIISVFFDMTESEALGWVFGLMAFVAAYSALSGLKGIVVTDAVQFIMAMTGAVVLAVVVLRQPEVGGLSGLQQRLPQWRLDFFPSFSSQPDQLIGAFSISIGAFLSYFTLQWWASWYPGNEPGGGGYISQRMMGSKTEKDAVHASLFFQIAHYALRPWPWIIVALGALLLYPGLGLEDSSKGYVLAMKDLLPAGLKGLLFVAFLSAYMSTISTQLNWGAGYLTHDLWGRFAISAKDASRERKLVRSSRVFTLLLMLLSMPLTARLGMIDEAANFLIRSGAGLGLVLILRWYWWRVNAWSEISATILPIAGMLLSTYWLEDALGPEFVSANGSFYFTVAFTTLGWLLVTFLTPAESEATLSRFYQKVRPDGIWKIGGQRKAHFNVFRLVAWLMAVVLTYSALFGVGALLLHPGPEWMYWTLSAVISGGVFIWAFRKSEHAAAH